MRFVLAAADHTWLLKATGELLQAGQRVVATVRDLASLSPVVAQEAPDAIVVLGDLGDVTGLATVLCTLAKPALVALGGDTVSLHGIATVIAPDAPLAPALKTLTVPQPTIATAQPATSTAVPQPHATMPVPQMATTTAAPQTAPSAPLPLSTPAPLLPLSHSPTPPFRPLAIHGVTGGAGTSTLALTLAAAGAEAGIDSLALTGDRDVAEARLGLTVMGVTRQLAPHLAVVHTTDTAWRPEQAYALSVSDGILTPGGQVVLVTRPTGAGRVATVRVAAEIRQAGGHLLHLVVVGDGSLEPAELAARVADAGVRLPYTILPNDPHVDLLNDTQGHALAAPRYGVAARALARDLWPDLPWPVEEKETEKAGRPAAPGLGNRLKNLIQLEE